MATTKLVNIQLTANAKNPEDAVKRLTEHAEVLGERLKSDVLRLEEMAKTVGKDAESYKRLAKEIEVTRESMNYLKDAEVKGIEKTKQLSDIVADLTNTKLRDLKTALGKGSRSLASLTGSPEDVARAKQIREEMKLVGDEIRKRTGEYVNMSQTVRNLGTVSDNTLSKAIKQQKELVADLNTTDATYKRELVTLKELEAEEVRRSNRAKADKAANVAFANQQAANEMLGKVKSGSLGTMSQQDIEAGKRAMQEYQQTLTMGSAGWRTYGEAIAQAEAHIRSFSEQQRISVAQASQMAQTGLLNGNAVSSNQIREAQRVLTAHKGTLTTPQEIQAVNEAIAQLEKQYQQLNSTMQNTGKIGGSVMDKVRQTLRNPGRAGGQDLTDTIKILQDRLKGLDPASKAFDRLQKKIKDLQQIVSGTRLSQEQFNKVLRNPKKASIDDLKKAYAMLQQQLNTMRRDGSQAYTTLERNARRLKEEIDSTTVSVQKQDGWFRNAIRNIGAYMGVFAAFNAVKNSISSATRENLAYSDSLADIRKVSGLTKEAINQLSVELAKADTRTSQAELASIAYTGAKLGMGKYGIKGMSDFVNAANQVNVALREDMGSDALKDLSKMVEVMGLIPKMGVEKSMLALSSSLFKLSSTTTASADQIVQFAKRLTGMSRAAGITADQLLALGSAADSMMLAPEVASTAYNKLITAMQKDPFAIEKGLDIPEGTISKLFEAGKMMDAIVLILEKMKEKGNMNALGDVFKDLGSDDGARLSNVLVTMSKNLNMLKSQLYTSNEAFREATAVTDEYNIQQETAAALLERSKNIWVELFINPEQISNTENMTRAVYDLSKALNENVVFTTSVRLAMNLLYASTANFVRFLPTFVVALLSGGVVAAIWKWEEAMKGIKKQIDEVKSSYNALTGAMQKKVVFASWISFGLVLASLVYNLYEVYKAQDKVAASQKKINEYFARGVAQAAEEKRKLDEYVRALSSATTSQQTRQELIAKFNNEYGEYLEKLGIEVNNVQDLRDAYQDLNKQLRRKAFLQMREEAYTEELSPLRKETHQEGLKLDQMLESLGTGAIDRRWMDRVMDDMKNTPIVGVERWNANSVGGYLYRQTMQNKYGSYYNRKTNKVFDPSTNKYVSELNDVSFSDLKDQIYSYVNKFIIEENMKNKIDKEFEKEIGDEDFDENFGILKKRKQKGKGNGKGNNEMSMAKSQANAVKANIEAFYEEQARKYLQWVSEMNQTDEKVSEAEQKAFMDKLEEKKKKALGDVRQDIASLTGTFQNTVKDIQGDIYGTITETDKGLLEAIGKSDIKALHNLFAKLGKDLSKENNRTLSENLGALLDEIFAKGSRDLRQAAEIVVKRQRELQAMLMKYDYKGTVTRNFTNKLQTEQLLPPAEGVDVSTTEGANKQNAAIDRMLTHVRTNPYELYDIDIESEKGQEKFREFLEEEKKVFDFTKMDLRHVILLYRELIDYVGEYTEAQKKEEDRQKKINDDAWKMGATYNQMKGAQNVADLDVKTQKIFGATKTDNEGKETLRTSWDNTAEDLGFAFKIDNDPEILLYRLRMEEAEKYYNFKKDLYAKGMASEAEYNESLQNYLTQAQEFSGRVLEDVSAQTNQLMSFMTPLQTFGEEVGEAFATMQTDAASGRKAVQTALKQMLKSFATETVQIIAKNEQQRANEAMHETELLHMRTTFQAAMLMAESTSGSSLLALKQQQDMTTEQLEALHQQKMAALKSAGIFGWCVSELGPIAGPIAYAGMMAVLMGLLNYALGLIGGGSENTTSNQPKINTKLVSGMLTYDQGNLKQMYLGNDGKLYAAKNEEQLPTGIVTQPVATTINGQPSLVGERGPELVVGRETTAAMMQNAPQLLQALLDYDKNRRLSALPAYDRGNLSEISTNTQQLSPNTQPALSEELLTQLLYYLQHPVAPNINMYGREGLHEKMKQADRFMKGK